ncbi:transposase [Aquisphaera insulae]|uniref:transposase n=1 Tax=Aquisphaera insulae TaxID=2712864 RepID=UPI0013EA9371|nr:transposase [Aquisphaera insulae]
MATPRSRLVDESVTPWYHCISRCVRRARLCGEGGGHRKDWIVDRLRELVGLFAVDCGGFAVMDNHLHLLLRLDSPLASAWSAEEVARRWLTLFPIRDVQGRPLPASKDRARTLAADAAWVATIRGRLADLGWFMKCLKEPLARLANREDGCTGAFWEGRFRSMAVRDEEALLAVAVYIDLNPFAAGVAATPEEAEHTSLRTRLDHAKSRDATEGTVAAIENPGEDRVIATATEAPVTAIEAPMTATAANDRHHEDGLWLLPTDDPGVPGGRYGLVPGYTLACHLRLVDIAARPERPGKVSLTREAESIFVRLGRDGLHWQEMLGALSRPRPPIRLGREQPARPPRRPAPARPRPAPSAPGPLSLAAGL